MRSAQLAGAVANDVSDAAKGDNGAAGAKLQLSSSERNEINKDPAVRQVMDLFGGTLAGVAPDETATSATDPDKPDSDTED